jgi:hypothetical protein
MYLNDTLHLCLSALESRYPAHVISANEATRVLPGVNAMSWTAGEIREMLQETAPQLLQGRARLVIDDQRCEILLPGHWGDQPVLLDSLSLSYSSAYGKPCAVTYLPAAVKFPCCHALGHVLDCSTGGTNRSRAETAFLEDFGGNPPFFYLQLPNGMTIGDARVFGLVTRTPPGSG